MSIKEKFMTSMMDKQMGNMSSEEKNHMMETMMEKFFSNMSEEEKSDMMQNMMPKMMGQMGNNPMMGMMSMMMGKKEGDPNSEGGKMPWEACMEMMSGMKESSQTAKFATPELRELFYEWCDQIEQEILAHIKEARAIDTADLSEQFKLSADSIKYLLGRLADKNLIDYCV